MPEKANREGKEKKIQIDRKMKKKYRENQRQDNGVREEEIYFRNKVC